MRFYSISCGGKYFFEKIGRILEESSLKKVTEFAQLHHSSHTFLKRTIGLISDTHGLLRPAALNTLKGSEIIIHAGDIGKPGIIEELQTLAPVYAIRGNVDQGDWANTYAPTAVVEFANHLFYVLHDLNELDLDPEAAGFSGVITGHSHRPKVFRKNGVLYVNPGSAGKRRFSLPISVGRLLIEGEHVEAEIEELEVGNK